MNKTSAFLSKLVTHPEMADYQVLDKLISKYPYVKAFWFLKAKKAYQQNHPAAASFFQQAALLSPNPEVLYQYIFHQKGLPASESAHPAPDTIAAEQDSSSLGQEKAVSPATPAQEAAPYSFTWWLLQTQKEKKSTYQPYSRPEKKPHNTRSTDFQKETQDPLDQQVREHIFHIQSPELKLSEQQAAKTIPFRVPKKENPVIEKFIKEEPQITPPSPEKVSSENKARESAMDESGFVSETLARIYREQGLHHKAIETYKKLILKFPEKSPYFAELIEDLEKQS